MPDTMTVGLDVGGTSTRVAVVNTAGELLGTGRAGGGNPTSHGAERAAEQVGLALRAALAGLDPAGVRAGTIGLAGAGRLVADPAGRAAFDRVWREAGLSCRYDVHGDALVGYAAGTAEPDGTILIAGTGAIATEVRGMVLDRVADGHGWLLGDAGSGFWIGREVVRRTLAELDQRREPGSLARAVLIRLTGSDRVAPGFRDTTDTVIQTVTRRPPVELATLAPLVMSAHRTGDPEARSIVAEAADLLTASVARIRPVDTDAPIVLAGGLLTADTPLAAAVHPALRERWPAAPLLRAGDGAAAAAWLAARALPEVTDPAALHRLILGPAQPLSPAP